LTRCKRFARSEKVLALTGVFIYLSQKDEVDRAAGIPEIRLARPGLSVFTRQSVKFQK
jgi:hypothetical protein